MNFLVSGVHRSGTSVTAHWVAATNLSLLDDPDWAILSKDGFLDYRVNSSSKAQLESHEVVKCPRAISCLKQCVLDYPSVRVILLFRKPVDVLCSILEAIKTKSKKPKTMLDLHMKNGGLLDGFCDYYRQNYGNALELVESGEKVTLICYEKLQSMGKDYLNSKIVGVHNSPFDFSFNYSPKENKLSPASINGAGRSTFDLLHPISELVDKKLGKIHQCLMAVEMNQ
jgi:hypothetical protein